MATVARMLPGVEDEITERLSRELAVAYHLFNRQAPIVSPSLRFPAGPHFHDGFGLTFWQYVEHIPADADDAAHMASAADALRHIHDALADYPRELPLLADKTDKCRALLEQDGALPALASADRGFLLTTYQRIVASIDKLSTEYVPIHGDAGPHNVFITPAGARYSDFEDASLGPREWDVGWLTENHLKTFEPVNRDLLRVMSDLRSLCVSVWCFAKSDMPDKLEAAEYHLGYLKDRFGGLNIRASIVPKLRVLRLNELEPMNEFGSGILQGCPKRMGPLGYLLSRPGNWDVRHDQLQRKLDVGRKGRKEDADDEWGLVEPVIAPGKTGGGKRTVIMREVVNGLMYILSTGCQWRAIPKDLPPRSRSTTTSICGHTTARWNESTTRFMSSVANERSGKPVRLPPSSTARA
jgi:hypothetical protein